MSVSVEKVLGYKSHKGSKYVCNHSYFDGINTSQKAYWLGFLYADGWVRNNKPGYEVGIKLNNRDIRSIEILKDDLSSTHKISPRKNNMSIFVIYSKEMYSSLVKKGVVQAKSYKDIFPKVETEYFSHFARGCFDGDGSIGARGGSGSSGSIGKGKAYSFITLTGRRSFCMWYKKKIEGILGIHFSVRNYKQNKNLVDIRIDGARQIQKFLTWLYKDADRYLERKYNRALALDFNLGE